MAEQAFRFVDGAAYERFIGRWSRAVAPRFLEWLDVPAGARWLDAGCGTGIQTETILQLCAPASVHATDIEPDQVEAAARGWAKARAVFEGADVCQLPSADASFDVVASALLINFVPLPLQGVQEMARVTRTGGLVAGYVWDFVEEQSPSGPLRRALRQVGVDVPDVPGTELSRLAHLQELFESVGLQEVETRAFDVCLAYESFEDFWEAQTPDYAPTTKKIRSMKEGEKKRLVRILRETLAPAPGGRIEFISRAHGVRGRVRARA